VAAHPPIQCRVTWPVHLPDENFPSGFYYYTVVVIIIGHW